MLRVKHNLCTRIDKISGCRTLLFKNSAGGRHLYYLNTCLGKRGGWSISSVQVPLQTQVEIFSAQPAFLSYLESKYMLNYSGTYYRMS